MRLTRNLRPDGICRYGLINFDKARQDGIMPEMIKERLGDLADYLEICRPHVKEEFFVIKLKDLNAKEPLHRYAEQADINGDPELAQDVFELALRAGKDHPYCKMPD